MTNRLGHGGSRPGRRIPLGIGTAGLVAGLVIFGLGELTHEFFPVEHVAVQLGGAQAMRPTLETIARADSRNSALTFGMMGGVLGLVLGLAGGLMARSAASAARGAVVGLFLGAILGVALPLALVPPFHRMQVERDTDDLVAPIALHATLWAPLGAVGGLAFAIGRRRPADILRSMLGGLLGAALGTMLFDVIGATLAPLAGTADAIPRTWPTRLLARLLVPLGTAVGIAMVAHGPASPAKSPESPVPAAPPDGGP